MNTKTIGREPSSDLMLDHTGVSGLHARLELWDDGRVYVVDAGSSSNTFLNRNDQWIRLHKAQLCVGDRIRFGEHEVRLSQLVEVFGKRAGVRLGEKVFSKRARPPQNHGSNEKVKNTAAMGKPTRNPLTGKIERQTSEQTIEQPIEPLVEHNQSAVQSDQSRDV